MNIKPRAAAVVGAVTLAAALATGCGDSGQESYNNYNDMYGNPISNADVRTYLNELDDFTDTGEFETQDEVANAVWVLSFECNPTLDVSGLTPEEAFMAATGSEMTSEAERIVTKSATQSACEYLTFK